VTKYKITRIDTNAPNASWASQSMSCLSLTL